MSATAASPSCHGRIVATTGALEILRWGNKWTAALCPFAGDSSAADPRANLPPCGVWCPHLDDGGSTAPALIRLTCGGSVRVLDGTPPQEVR